MFVTRLIWIVRRTFACSVFDIGAFHSRSRLLWYVVCMYAYVGDLVASINTLLKVLTSRAGLCKLGLEGKECKVGLCRLLGGV